MLGWFFLLKVVELWTKRKFRCDCGNSKFGSHVCKLCPEKDPENPVNSYNHNFKGSYCTCGRPYPDPEAEKQVEMIQCCICEDWFHEDHIGLNSIEEVTFTCSTPFLNCIIFVNFSFFLILM
jgi:E3 ubiquitin-protein ligase UBR7